MQAFEEIIGYEDIKNELYKICDTLKNPMKYKQFGVMPPKGLLLYGVPGSGKTMLANAVIKESGYKAYTIRRNGMKENFAGYINEVFENAKRTTPSIVFLDDMDKYANEDENHRDAEEYVVIQSCIDECADKGIFVIGAVNNKYRLPDSLIRAGRFDTLIEVSAPVGEDAVKIVQYYIAQKKNVGCIDAEEIVRLIQGCSCAELEKVVNEAGIYAAYQGKEKIEQEDIIKACLRKIYDAPECVHDREKAFSSDIALHEAGHAVIAEILTPGSVNLISVCQYAGETKGVTSIRKLNEKDYSKQLIENRMIGILGGKAATEIVKGVADVRCASDLDQVYGELEILVERVGIYNFDTLERYDSSEDMKQKTEKLIAYEMERYYKEAKKILAENRKFLDAVTEALIKNRWLTRKDIKGIKKSVGLEK